MLRDVATMPQLSRGLRERVIVDVRRQVRFGWWSDRLRIAAASLAKGKAEHDKRDTEKKRDWEREKGQLMRHKVSSKP